MMLCEAEKLSLTQEVLQTARDALEAGRPIEHLLSYGFDLLSQLCPPSAPSHKLREFISAIANHFITSNQGALLYLIKNACEFMLASFPEEGVEVRELFRTLLFKGKRDEIRCIFRVSKQQLLEDQYHALRRHLYGYTSGTLNHRQLTALCELLITAMDLAKPTGSVREVVSNVEEEDKATAKEREGVERGVVLTLTKPCLQEVEVALSQSRFKKEVWERVSSQLSRIALFRTLFRSEFHAFQHCERKELLDIFQRKFPEEVLTDEGIMQLLASSATRIEHMQIPRYDSLKTQLSNILRHFLNLDLAGHAHNTDHAHQEAPLKSAPLTVRNQRLQSYLDAFPRNREDKASLLARGYSESLWTQRVSLSVKTDGSLSLEENLRQNLLACFSEFSNILHQMAVTHVSVDGEMVKVSLLFTEDLSLADLKGRRAIAVRTIDQRRGGGGGEGHFYERKAALLSKEDQIEAEFEKMAKAAIKPKTFSVAVNTGFFDCARCCGNKIIGCYAPTGEHCERPLEIGMRTDSAIASIYDDAGQEIENAELLFTEEGVFLFKAYTNGHPYDTSQIWVSLFAMLLKEEEEEEEEEEEGGGSHAHSLIPALIVPRGYPNQRTWQLLRRTHSTELTGSLLTCRPDFSPEWRSYYDHRPERVNMGTDMVLHVGFSASADQSQRPVLRRQRSKFTKDLAGMIFEDAMQKLLENKWWQQFRFLGKLLSQHISLCVTTGNKADSNLFSTGLDYKRWEKTFRDKKFRPPPPVSLLFIPSSSSSSSPSLVPSKEAIVSNLTAFLEQQIVRWCSEVDVAELCISNHKQLLELKAFLERADGIFKQPAVLKRVQGVLGQCLVMVPILSLPDSLQEEIIHWVFRNEDRVWRYRGGRSGHETIQQFMNFLGRPPLPPTAAPPPAPPNTPPDSDSAPSSSPPSDGAHRAAAAYAGVVVLCQPSLLGGGGRSKFDATTATVNEMVGYSVGEMIREEEGEEEEEGGCVVRWRPRGRGVKCYEVVMAWVHPGYRGLRISIDMYLTIIQQVPAALMMCDMVEGSVERVIASNVLLRALNRMHLTSRILQHRHPSYTVTTQTGVTEQFEQVVLSTRPLKLALGVYRVGAWLKSHPNTSIGIGLAATGLAVAAALLLPSIRLKLR